MCRWGSCSNLRLGSQDLGVQRVRHDVARGVSHPDEDIGGDVLAQVNGGDILAPGLFGRAARRLRGPVGGHGGTKRLMDH